VFLRVQFCNVEQILVLDLHMRSLDFYVLFGQPNIYKARRILCHKLGLKYAAPNPEDELLCQSWHGYLFLSSCERVCFEMGPTSLHFIPNV
jgi:hypothetical protein